MGIGVEGQEPVPYCSVSYTMGGEVEGQEPVPYCSVSYTMGREVEGQEPVPYCSVSYTMGREVEGQEPVPYCSVSYTMGIGVEGQEPVPYCSVSYTMGIGVEGQEIIFYCDNEATLHIINKGRSKVQPIMRLMKRLTWYATSRNFIIIAKHIRGINNNIADALLDSRPADSDNSPPGQHSNPVSVHALGCDVILGSVVDQLWDMSINKSTTTVYEADFRAFRKFSYMYPSGSLSPTHPTLSEEILINFMAL